MNWFKKADNNFTSKIKKILKGNDFIVALARYYNIPLEEIDTHLKIEICDLKGKYAEGNGKIIRIDSKLVEKDFFNRHFHFVIHEFFHWLKRRSEEKFYFNDPEEVQSFVLQITWELMQGKNKEDITKTIYPIISTHFHDKEKSNKLFKEMLSEAEQLFNLYTKMTAEVM